VFGSKSVHSISGVGSGIDPDHLIRVSGLVSVLPGLSAWEYFLFDLEVSLRNSYVFTLSYFGTFTIIPPPISKRYETLLNMQN